MKNSLTNLTASSRSVGTGLVMLLLLAVLVPSACLNLRLSRLIDNFLTFSRIERNKYAFKFAELPAARIIEDVVASVRDRFNAPGCELKVDTAPRLPSVVADGDAMVTAHINPLDNAFKYTGDEKRISLSAAAENGSVRFSVKDNGIGLSGRDSKRIFKRFYQVDQRLSRAGGGCGLGLSIVKFIVSAHHGSVEVRSQPGEGSVFMVSIPSRWSLGRRRDRNRPQRGPLRYDFAEQNRAGPRKSRLYPNHPRHWLPL